MTQISSSHIRRISSLLTEGQYRPAIVLFQDLHKTGLNIITEFILSPILKACGKLSASKQGKQLHCSILKKGFSRDTVLMTSLLDMYSKCNLFDEGYNVFVEMPDRDVVAYNSMISGLCRRGLTSKAIALFEEMSERDEGTWNSVISGLLHNSQGNHGLVFFQRMRFVGVRVDAITMVSVLSVCADIAALLNGRQVHGLAAKYGLELYLPVGNAVVDMYAKCGCINDASLFFKNMGFKNVVSWTSLIAGYGKHGLGIDALNVFDAMEMKGVLPNKITFLSVLYACSHAGLVHEGWKIFNKMVYKYSFTPIMEHYTCMVDLLARAGYINDTHNFIESMPVKPDAKLMTAFLSSCCFHRNVEVGKQVATKLLELEPQEAGAYMLLSNFYGLVGDLNSVANVRRSMLNKGIRKEQAYTWIEIDKKVHTFESGDRSHPLSNKIYSYLHNLLEKMRKIGYIPKTTMVMRNVDEHTKKEILLGHSEKLAIGLGLISTPPGTSIMIVKNLRVCVDCHEVTALISKIEGRQIVARDSSRFHYFRDGSCSCGNHW